MSEFLPEAQKPSFPETIECRQCRRPYRVRACNTKINTLLTEMAIVCPRCKKKLHIMKLKDWYDHYVQGQGHPTKDTLGTD